MLRIFVKTYLVYLGVSLLVVLPALNFIPRQFVDETFGRDLQTEIILFNPFTLAVEVRSAALAEKNGNDFAGFSSAEVNLSLESIWSRGWVFDAIRLEGMYVDIQRLENGEFNFSDLMSAGDPPEQNAIETDQNAPLPGVTIVDFFIQSEWIKFTDEGRAKPFTTQYDGLEIAVHDLSTVREEDKPYRLDVRGEAGGLLHWEGVVSVPKAFSRGTLSLSNVSLLTASRFIEPWVAFELADGRLAVEGNYDLNWDDGVKYSIEKAQVGLTDLAVVPRDTEALPETSVNLNQLLVSGLQIDGSSEQVDIASIALTGLEVNGWSEGSELSLATLFAPSQSAASNDEPAAENNWSVAVARTTLTESRLQWRSEYTQPAQLLVSPLETTVLDLNWPFKGDTQILVNLAVNDLASLTIDALLALDSGSGEISYSVEDLPVKWFNPNLPKGVDAAISKGQVNIKGGLSLAEFAPTRVRMDGAVTDFSMSVEDSETAITDWKSVRWQKLDLDLVGSKLAMKGLFIDGYSGRLHIFEDGSINAQRALREEADKAEADPPADPQPAKPWSFSVPTIAISNSKLDFTDESLPIKFRTVIGDLNGDISGLNSDPASTTQIKLAGSVDGYAPVLIAGSAKPFSSPPDLDLSLNFDGVDLARLSPYSGTYAGYAIDRGILNLDLKYSLAEAKLDGQNEIVINQLKLGKKIKSDKAVDLPLGLAIALLTDLNGVIDLSVPVSGNVDDPQFNLGSVIFSTLINIITKAVTAPFNLLAGLVNSDEDLQRVTFSSGSSDLDETARAKLNDLHSALMQRPELVLIISARLHPRADLESLQKNTLRAELIAAGLPEGEWENRGPQWSEAIAARYNTLEKASSEGGDISASEQLNRIMKQIPISDDVLKKLAEDRAVQTKRYLVNEAQLPAERSVIEKFDIRNKANLFSGVEMKIDS